LYVVLADRRSRLWLALVLSSLLLGSRASGVDEEEASAAASFQGAVIGSSAQCWSFRRTRTFTFLAWRSV